MTRLVRTLDWLGFSPEGMWITSTVLGVAVLLIIHISGLTGR